MDVFEVGRSSIGFGVADMKDEVVFDLEFLEEPDDALRLGVLEGLLVELRFEIASRRDKR